METRVALIGILIDDPMPWKSQSDPSSIKPLDCRTYGHSLSRPYINIISVVVDAPQDEISRMSGLIGKLSGVTAKIAYAKLPNHEA